MLLTADSYYPQADNIWEARFLLMTDHWNEQTQELGNCNTRLRGLRDWYNRQRDMEASE